MTRPPSAAFLWACLLPGTLLSQGSWAQVATGSSGTGPCLEAGVDGLPALTAGWAADLAVKRAHAKWKPDAKLYSLYAYNVVGGKITKRGSPWQATFASKSDPENEFNVSVLIDGTVTSEIAPRANLKPPLRYPRFPDDQLDCWSVNSDGVLESGFPPSEVFQFSVEPAEKHYTSLYPVSLPLGLSDNQPVISLVKPGAPNVQLDGTTGRKFVAPRLAPDAGGSKAVPVVLLALSGADDKTRAEIGEVAREVVRRAGETTRDVSPVYRALFAARGPQGTSFQTYREAPPSGWPAALDGDWKAGLEGCRGVAGLPLAKLRPEGLERIVACDRALATALWKRFVEIEGPARVLVLRTLDAAGGSGVLGLSGWLYGAGDSSARTQSKKVGTGQESLPLATGDLVRALLAGKGESEPRRGGQELPRALTVLTEDKPLRLAAVPLPGECKGREIPGILDIGPRGNALAKSLSFLWEGSAAQHLTATAPPLGCTLGFAEVPEAGQGPARLTATLVCKDTIVAWGSVPSWKGAGEHPAELETLTRELFDSLARGICVSP